MEYTVSSNNEELWENSDRYNSTSIICAEEIYIFVGADISNGKDETVKNIVKYLGGSCYEFI